MKQQLLRDSFRVMFESYLSQVQDQLAPEQLQQLQAGFDRDLAVLVDFCLQGYPRSGALTTAFIRQLHRALYPQAMGETTSLAQPGEYKSVNNNASNSMLQPGKTISYLVPERVPAAMEQLVNSLNQNLVKANSASEKRDAIMQFLIYFLAIHPFVDANGRVACILADLLAVQAELSPPCLHRFKMNQEFELYQALELAQQQQDFSLVRLLQAHYG